MRKLDQVLALAVAVLLAAAIPVGVLGLVGLQDTADELRARARPLDAESDDARVIAAKLVEIQWAFGLDSAAIVVSLAGAALAVVVALRYPRSGRRHGEAGLCPGEAGWPMAAGAAAVVFVVLDAAPAASSLPPYLVTLIRGVVLQSAGSAASAPVEALAIARFAMAVAAGGLFVVIAARIVAQPPSAEGKRIVAQPPSAEGNINNAQPRAAVPHDRRLFYGLTCGSLAAAALFFNLWSPPPPKPVPIAKPLRMMADEVLARMPAGWTGRHEPFSEKDEKLVGADDYLNLIMLSPDKQCTVGVYITYNADAMSNIPHVPWICMTQSGAFEVASRRKDDLAIKGMGREVPTNVLLFHPGAGRGGPDVFMFQYFNAGGTYENDRDVARIIAAAGAHSQAGSFISQTQVQVRLAQSDGEDQTDRHSRAYGLGLQVLNVVAALLEKEYYPDLRGTGGVQGEK